jgi:hypothetical protein
VAITKAVPTNSTGPGAGTQGSDRSFGLVFSVVFLIVALWPLFHDEPVRVWAIAVASVFLIAALVRPQILVPLNRAWTAFGHVLHAIVTPVVTSFLFFVLVTPMALVMRVMGSVPLRLSFDADAQSYWIVRTPPGPPTDSMKNQF